MTQLLQFYFFEGERAFLKPHFSDAVTSGHILVCTTKVNMSYPQHCKFPITDNLHFSQEFKIMKM